MAHPFAREEALRPVVRFVVIARLTSVSLPWPSSIQPRAVDRALETLGIDEGLH